MTAVTIIAPDCDIIVVVCCPINNSFARAAISRSSEGLERREGGRQRERERIGGFQSEKSGVFANLPYPNIGRMAQVCVTGLSLVTGATMSSINRYVQGRKRII